MKRISPATIIATLALFFALTGAGVAASHYLITNTSQIAPSVRHALRGERGLRGVPGPQGQPGPRAEGSASTESATTTVAAGGEATVTATCGIGGAPTGGGFSADKGLTVRSSQPVPGQGFFPAGGWQVTADNSTGGALTVKAWALCMR